MRVATDSARGLLTGRVLVYLGLASSLCVFHGGCAGLGFPRETGQPLVGAFWGRARKTADPAGYDLYAQSMAEGRKRAGTAPALAGSVTPRPEKGREPAGDPEATVAAAADSEARSTMPGLKMSRSRSAPAEDTAIRVTLGRPESLPTLNSPSGSSAVLASAASTTWKQPGAEKGELMEPVARPRPRSASNLSSSRQEPRPRPERPAPTDEQRLRAILAKSKSKLDSMATYQVMITRVERVGGQLQPEEEVLLSIRRNPRAVRLEWPKGPSKGREVIYSAAINDRMMYVNNANSALPIPRMTIAVDSPLVMRNSRHAITEAGFDTILQNLFKHLDTNAAVNVTGKLTYKGLEAPKGLPATAACHLIERITPQGETWQVYLDTRTMMPIQVVAYQPDGQLLERYSYRNLQANPTVLASAEAFDPDKRWGESKDWLSRLARAAGAPGNASSAPPTTR